jgi:hypothetical protein
MRLMPHLKPKRGSIMTGKSLVDVAMEAYFATVLDESPDPFKASMEAAAQAVAAAVRAETIQEIVTLITEFHWELPMLKDVALNEATDDAACSVQEQIIEAIRALNKEGTESS